MLFCCHGNILNMEIMEIIILTINVAVVKDEKIYFVFNPFLIIVLTNLLPWQQHYTYIQLYIYKYQQRQSLVNFA